MRHDSHATRANLQKMRHDSCATQGGSHKNPTESRDPPRESPAAPTGLPMRPHDSPAPLGRLEVIIVERFSAAFVEVGLPANVPRRPAGAVHVAAERDRTQGQRTDWPLARHGSIEADRASRRGRGEGPGYLPAQPLPEPAGQTRRVGHRSTHRARSAPQCRGRKSCNSIGRQRRHEWSEHPAGLSAITAIEPCTRHPFFGWRVTNGEQVMPSDSGQGWEGEVLAGRLSTAPSFSSC